VYQAESLGYWRRLLGRDDIGYGGFGENLTVDGLADAEVCIGDRASETVSNQTGPLSVFRRKTDNVPAHAREQEKRAPKNKVAKQDKQGALRSPYLCRGTFGPVTAGWWAAITAPFGDAGWTAADILYAVDHYPGGRPHRATGSVRVPAALLRWRLSHWTYSDGTPIPSRSQDRAERARAAREHRRRQDAELGLAVGRQQLRANNPAAYDQATPDDSAADRQDAPAAPRSAPARLVGWAVPRYGPTAPSPPLPGPYETDPEWRAMMDAAAAAAAAEAEDAAAR
jgi:hypothetical protein